MPVPKEDSLERLQWQATQAEIELFSASRTIPTPLPQGRVVISALCHSRSRYGVLGDYSREVLGSNGSYSEGKLANYLTYH